jgi:arylsulfatase A-like enzyme
LAKSELPNILVVWGCQFGKNHLSDLNNMLPTNHGFDEFFGNLYHAGGGDTDGVTHGGGV